jgi:hypothetical protein
MPPAISSIDLGHGEQGVYLPQDHRGIANAGFEFVRHRTGHLGLVELHAADPQKRAGWRWKGR